MAGSGRKSSRAVAALALACGEPVAEAARRAKVGERTLYRWQKEPGFQDEITSARAEMCRQALGRFTEGLVGSAVTIRYLALKAKSEAVRLAAARSVIDGMTRLRDQAEFATLLRNLQEEVRALQQSHRGRSVPPQAGR
jgi:Arc/MetJ family transcription regulator